MLRVGLVLALAMATAAQTVVPALASFNPAVNSADGTTPVAIAVGDLNGDTKRDAALADYGSNIPGR
ncbi:MAG: hypothetical protein E6J12_00095 [Chloroflexi bacterium]|nr:MAG: hypothetical protein E6J12_00095 [Chloroflexota bacterium]